MKGTRERRGFTGAADLAQHAARAIEYLKQVCAACATGDKTTAQRALRQAQHRRCGQPDPGGRSAAQALFGSPGLRRRRSRHDQRRNDRRTRGGGECRLKPFKRLGSAECSTREKGAVRPLAAHRPHGQTSFRGVTPNRDGKGRDIAASHSVLSATGRFRARRLRRLVQCLCRLPDHRPAAALDRGAGSHLWNRGLRHPAADRAD